MDTGSFLGLKRRGRGVDHPPTSSADVKETVELYLYSPYGGDRIPVEARFSAHVQTGRGTHPASYIWIPGLSRG